MQNAYASLVFTPAVQAHQQRMGSASAYDRIRSTPSGEAIALSRLEKDFIESRDGFYQATVSETGWPYVQHRGGPAGFLRVLGPQTLAYCDFSGNRQYISRGNFDGNNRVALILMDYPRQRRLKLMGRVEIVEGEHAAASLYPKGAKTPAERAILIHVEAFDWNCPRHITPRFTREEYQQDMLPLQQQITTLQEENLRLRQELENTPKTNVPFERTPL